MDFIRKAMVALELCSAKRNSIGEEDKINYVYAINEKKKKNENPLGVNRTRLQRTVVGKASTRPITFIVIFVTTKAIIITFVRKLKQLKQNLYGHYVTTKFLFFRTNQDEPIIFENCLYD